MAVPVCPDHRIDQANRITVRSHCARGGRQAERNDDRRGGRKPTSHSKGSHAARAYCDHRCIAPNRSIPRELLVVWLLFAIRASAVFITYARLPARELYNVTGSGLVGGASRVLVFYNLPDRTRVRAPAK